MIAIVDYGAGHLVALKKALDWLRQECAITSDPGQVARATKVVLPGVGHFASTAALSRSGLRDAIAEAIGREIPFLGICVGMQWMFERSQESPETSGLGVLNGECERFPASVKSPHVGWNQIDVALSSRLLRGLPSLPFVYFTHSFRAPVSDTTVACCEYGGQFSAAAGREGFVGGEFFPQKYGGA